MGSLSTSRARHKRAISADSQDGLTPLERGEENAVRAFERRRHARRSDSDQLLVGAEEIARELGQPERRIYHWLAQGVIKSVVQRGRLYTVTRRALRSEFGFVD
jgi:hypothetical protein